MVWERYCIKDILTKHDWLTDWPNHQLMNYQGACRTALATPGLLKTCCWNTQYTCRVLFYHSYYFNIIYIKRKAKRLQDSVWHYVIKCSNVCWFPIWFALPCPDIGSSGHSAPGGEVKNQLGWQAASRGQYQVAGGIQVGGSTLALVFIIKNNLVRPGIRPSHWIYTILVFGENMVLDLKKNIVLGENMFFCGKKIRFFSENKFFS